MIRPLRRIGPGIWRSRDGRWTFLRHQSDPSPQRWFIYEGGDEYPCNEGSGIVALREAVNWVSATDESNDSDAPTCQRERAHCRSR